MSDEQPLNEDNMEIGRIEIIVYLTPEGHECSAFRAQDINGNDMPLVSVLGYLALTQDSAITQYMQKDEDE